jgi:hypothetical protein
VTFDANRNKELLYFIKLLAFLLCFLASTQLNAQVAGGTLSGRIISSTGARIANAHLTIKDTVSGDTNIIAANADASFAVADLSPGIFEIKVSAPGFVEVRTTVTVRAGTDSHTDIVMHAETTPGTAEGGTSGVSGVVSSKSVTDLPLNGRSASDLATLEPGVATARTQSTGQGQRGFGTQMTISGGRPRQNDSRLDGISVNDYVNGPPGSALGVNLGSDAVEQFTVLSSNYPAQFGRSSGGIIGASTRSGTKEFHGNAFEYLRNSAFDARNFFDTTKPAFNRNQFGGSIGGPITKHGTFFFADYEGLRQSQGITQVDTTPSQAARDGHLCAPPNCSTTTTIAVDPEAARFLKAFYPLPNGSLLCPLSSCAAGTGDTGIFTFAGQTVTPENYFTVKIDHTFSAQDTLSGTYMFDSGTVRQPDELDNKRTGYDSQRQFFALHEAHTFNPLLLNSFRFGINRVVATTGLTFASGNPDAANPSFGTVPGRNAAGITVPGLTAFLGGLGAIGSYHFHWTSIQLYDDVTFINGSHSWKFGGGIERIRDNILATSDPNGVFSFNSLSDFLTNHPFFLSAGIPSTSSERGFRQTIVGAYLQDDWRWRPNVTINLGLRYEMATVPTEVQGKLTVLRQLTDALPVCGKAVAGCSGTGALFSNPTLKNFEPRVGLSWDPFRDGKTSVSGGFGIFDVLPLPYVIQFNELFSAPFYDLGSATNLPAGSFPKTAYNIVAGSSNTFRQAYFEPHPNRNYVMQWNLTVQREIATDLSMRIGYVGSRGVHQPFRVEDADIVLPPTLTPQGYLWPSPIGSGTRLNLNSGRITAAFWEGDSFYDALQIQVKKKFGQGLQIEGSYTWGKTIDTSSGSLVGDEYSNSISSPLWFNTKLNRGLADFNVAHNLEVNFTWDLGTPKLASGFASWALGGWQLGGVFEASTGVPFTPGFAGDTLGVKSTDPNIDVPNLSGGSGCGSLVNPGNPLHYFKTQCFGVPSPAPGIAADCVNVVNIDPVTGNPTPDPRTCLNLRGNLGRNTLIGPGLLNFDFSVFKNSYIKRISDSFNVQFRAEFFNILNRANFAPPLDNRNVFDSNGHPIANAGLITSTQTPSRQIQFAIKVIW